MIDQRLDQIQKSDIEDLVKYAKRENAMLEFKQQLPGTSDTDKHEFLADVSSFANARGGDIVYGIVDKKDESGQSTGEAGDIEHVKDQTPDKLIQKLEQQIREGISPRLSCQIKEIPGFGVGGVGFVLIIRIPKSMASPHMVCFKKSSKFYSRHSSGKIQLDVKEIRDSFLATESQAERIRQFRIDRIARILADDTPVPLSSPKRFILHVLPISPFLNRERLDLATHQNSIRDLFRPIGNLNGRTRFNLNGLLTWHERSREPGHGYSQLFFDGSFEIVFANNFVTKTMQYNDRNSTGGIPASALEEQVIESLRAQKNGYELLEVQGPFAISISIIGCKGCWLDGRLGFGAENLLDSDVVNLHEVVLEKLGDKLEFNLKPLFDQIWNAFGYGRSESYDQNGNRII